LPHRARPKTPATPGPMDNFHIASHATELPHV
jgi:hypothetical protein